eukprot:4654282-Pyramimonas_sp.AAC.1
MPAGHSNSGEGKGIYPPAIPIAVKGKEYTRRCARRCGRHCAECATGCAEMCSRRGRSAPSSRNFTAACTTLTHKRSCR